MQRGGPTSTTQGTPKGKGIKRSYGTVCAPRSINVAVLLLKARDDGTGPPGQLSTAAAAGGNQKKVA